MATGAPIDAPDLAMEVVVCPSALTPARIRASLALHKSLRLESFANGGFSRNNETKLGWVLNETWTRAKPERVRLARRLSCCGRQPAVPMTPDARRRPGRTVRDSFLGVCV